MGGLTVFQYIFSGKSCPLEEQQEQEMARLKEEENDDQAQQVEFVPKKDGKQKEKKTEKKKASLLRAMVYLFGPQFLFGMFLKLIYDIIQFVQPQLVK